MTPEDVPDDQGVEFAEEMESLKEKKEKDSLQHIKLEADFSFGVFFRNRQTSNTNFSFILFFF